MALGGVLAALAVVIMCLGGLIPASTYVCPMLCMLMEDLVRRVCGSRTALAWYGAVSLLCLLMGPDKEAAAVFLFLGYYPVIKPVLDQTKPGWLWKGLYFNVSVIVMYWLLMRLFGMAELAAEFQAMGRIMLVVLLLAGNLIFVLIDRILTRGFRIGKGRATHGK